MSKEGRLRTLENIRLGEKCIWTWLVEISSYKMTWRLGNNIVFFKPGWKQSGDMRKGEIRESGTCLGHGDEWELRSGFVLAVDKIMMCIVFTIKIKIYNKHWNIQIAKVYIVFFLALGPCRLILRQDETALLRASEPWLGLEGKAVSGHVE